MNIIIAVIIGNILASMFIILLYSIGFIFQIIKEKFYKKSNIISFEEYIKG